MAPLGRPRFEHARTGRRELDDVCGGARRSSGVDIHRVPVLPAAVRQLHHRRRALLRRWHGHYCDGTLVPGLGGLRDGGSFYPWRLLRHVLCEALVLGPRGLEHEGLLGCLTSRALLRVPASFSFCDRSGGAVRIALTGRNSNGRLGDATGTALAGLLGVGRLSSRFCATLAGVALLLCPGLLRRLGPSGHGLP